MQQIADGAGASAIKENAGSPAQYVLAVFGRSPGESQARGKVVRLVVKIILEVIPHSDIDGKVGAEANVIFEKSANYSFQELNVPLPTRRVISGRNTKFSAWKHLCDGGRHVARAGILV